MNLKLDSWTLQKLSEPFDPSEVKWLPAFGGSGSGAYAYVDVRTILNRLNEVVGVENWHDSYTESIITGTETRDVTDYELLLEHDRATKKGYKIQLKSESDRKFEYNDIRYGGIRCSLTILGVTKSDVGVPSFAEQLKGAYSDALKRAAVRFGIGEYFYRLGTVPAQVEYGRVVNAPALPEWALPRRGPNPDEVIERTIAEIVERGLEDAASEALEAVSVMGSYNPYTPLIVKRAAYEQMRKILDGAKIDGAKR